MSFIFDLKWTFNPGFHSWRNAPIYPGLCLAFRNALACAFPLAGRPPRVHWLVQRAAAPISGTIQVHVALFCYTLGWRIFFLLEINWFNHLYFILSMKYDEWQMNQNKWCLVLKVFWSWLIILYRLLCTWWRSDWGSECHFHYIKKSVVNMFFKKKTKICHLDKSTVYEPLSPNTNS